MTIRSKGISFALAACAAWGFVFVAPLLLPKHHTITLTLARYVAYGLFSLCLWFLVLTPTQRRIPRALWVRAFWLSLIGNVVYFGCLSIGLRHMGTARVAVMTGALPVIIAVVSNFTETHERIAWRTLAVPLLCISLGIVAVHAGETQFMPVGQTDLAIGLLASLAAVLAWTWYPIQNTRCLRQYPEHSPLTHSVAQGLAILPVTACLWLMIEALAPASWSMFYLEQHWRFLLVTFVCGVIASGLGAWAWNEASSRLPSVLAGQLIVFETLFSLLYAFLIEARLPNWWTLTGACLLVAGVWQGVKRCAAAPAH
jgi:drug/metabolite transporter (DMT)-like permease